MLFALFRTGRAAFCVVAIVTLALVAYRKVPKRILRVTGGAWSRALAQEPRELAERRYLRSELSVGADPLLAARDCLPDDSTLALRFEDAAARSDRNRRLNAGKHLLFPRHVLRYADLKQGIQRGELSPSARLYVLDWRPAEPLDVPAEAIEWVPVAEGAGWRILGSLGAAE